MPARAAKPRDKAQVAVGGQGVERWRLARLRHHPFFALVDVHTAIAALLPALNTRPFKKLPGSRPSRFESLDRPALTPFPVRPYTYAEWQLARVNIDYHLAGEGPSYAVPYALVKQQLAVRLSAQVVDIFPKGTRVASHQRSRLKGRHSTGAAHLPKAHRRSAAWPPQRLGPWAAHSGPATAQVVATILASRPPPQQGFRACVGILRLGKSYGDERLEAAGRRALTLGACSYKSIEAIRTQGLDRQPVPEQLAATPAARHANIRGPQYDQEDKGERSGSTIRRWTTARPCAGTGCIPHAWSRGRGPL